MIVGRFVKPWTIALVAVLLVAVSPIRGMSVLCISDQGHLEVESIGSSCCDQEPAPQIPTAPLVEESTDDCGTCVDVLFAQDASRASQRGLSAHYGNSLFASILSTPLQLTDFLGANASKEINPYLDFSIVAQARSRFPTVIRC
jgi:hypothetical protein